ncbi:serine/threonine protein kinase [Planctomicrobium sp. SH668]|uniref:serine/threonine protein kinase n=1 Tax=Planctomicrobium sp. SH668 TaxID=3448126 RepID=UPI003F5C268B
MKFTFQPDARPLAGYTLKRAIHRGGFGEVYYALSDGGREVALKLLQNNVDVELRGVQQCLNLTHPNLVTIFDIRSDDEGDHWIVMEYVPGETLESQIRKHPTGMPLELVRRWLPGMVAGMEFLHRSGLVHRDLKPANIFIDQDQVKIGDVGLSKFITPSRQSAHTQSVGTVYYMAPEVAKGRYGLEVDIYAMGVIVYEMLTGLLPFDGESTGEILMKHLTEKPDLNKLPPRLQPVVAKALEKEPSRRFTSMKSFLDAFNAAVIGKAEAKSAKAETSGQDKRLPPAVKVKNSSCSKRPAAPKQKGPCSFGTGEKGDSLPMPIFFVILITCIVISRRYHDSGPVWLAIPLAAVTWPIWAKLSRQRAESNRLATQGSLTIPTVVPENPGVNWRKRASGFFTSCLIVVPIAGLFTLIPLSFYREMFEVDAGYGADAGVVVTFLATTIVACWSALAVPAFLRQVNQKRPSRWNYLFPAVLTALTASGVSKFLATKLPVNDLNRPRAIINSLGDQPFITASEGVTPAGFAVFFSLLFLLRNWNKVMSPFRESRFSFFSVAGTALVAVVATRFFQFPIEWALAWSVIVTCTLQLASPWSGTNRNAIRH